MNGKNFNDDERGLLPFPVILAATKGDPDAMKVVLQHYQSYIAHLSMRKIRDTSGNTFWGIDEDLRERLQAKLMRAILNFKIKKIPNLGLWLWRLWSDTKLLFLASAGRVWMVHGGPPFFFGAG